MHQTILLLALALAPLSVWGQNTASMSPHFIEAANPDIVVEGRYAPAPAGGLELGFPGIVLYCRYHGSALTMRLKSASDAAMFDVVVDGGNPVVLQTTAGEHDYPLFNAPAAGDHVIAITRRTESWEGVCEVMGFGLGPDGSLLPPPVLPAHKLLFIGDSITCGAMADYDANTPQKSRTEFNSQWSNADAAFGKILARELDAQCQLVSYGGRGLIRDWRGLTNVCNAPQFYKLAAPDDPAASWDPARYVADAVGICLGQNDFNPGIPDEEVFVGAYVQFVKEIRHDAPKVWIFLLNSPIIGDDPHGLPKRSVLRGYLEEVVAKLGDPRVALAPVSQYRGNSFDGHPTAADHKAMATELEPMFRKALASD